MVGDRDGLSDNPLAVDGPLEQKLIACHRRINNLAGYQSLGRMAVATYDRDSDALSVFADSDLRGDNLRLCSAPLFSVPALCELAQSGKVRVVGDAFRRDAADEARSIAIRHHYRSSLTVPIRRSGKFYGFVFFNSELPDFFTYEVIERVLPYGQLVAAMVVAEVDRMETLMAAVRHTREIGNLRDDETAGHLQRMTAYTRLIAAGLAAACELNERWIDMITQFAPLHDVGKIGIPDSILFKPAKLDEGETAVMRGHVDVGRRIIEAMLANFAIADRAFATMLLNVVACHHETLDGAGYPNGLSGDAVPLEARIVTVADIFDAITSDRPYKRRWPVDDAFAHLRQLAGAKLDGRCVEILLASRPQIESIREKYQNDVPGTRVRVAVA